MKTRIKITVTGEAGTGKSTVAQLIRHALAQYGIRSAIIDDDEVDATAFDHRIESIADRMVLADEGVDIVTVQANRPLKK